MSAAVCPNMVDVSWRSIYRSSSHGQLVYAMQAEFRVLDSLAYRLSTGRDAIPGQIVTSGGRVSTSGYNRIGCDSGARETAELNNTRTCGS